MENVNEALMESRIPKYLKIHGQKVITPKDIKPLDIYDGKFPIYGDPRIKNVVFDEVALNLVKEKKQFLVVLKKTKSRGSFHAFPVELSKILEQRRYRLANFINIQKINESNPEIKKEDVQTASDFVRAIIPVEEEWSEEQIFDEFQTSMDPVLICMDIKRIIQLYYQE